MQRFVTYPQPVAPVRPALPAHSASPKQVRAFFGAPRKGE